MSPSSPANAVVFSVDEKSAIKALDRLDPVLPLSPGRAERHGFEYKRNGIFTSTTDLRRKLMHYIRQHNKTCQPIKWSYSNPKHRIRASIN